MGICPLTGYRDENGMWRIGWEYILSYIVPQRRQYVNQNLY